MNAGILCAVLSQSAANPLVNQALAQDTTSPIKLIPRTPEQREQRYYNSHRITLLVEVTDSSGKPVAGLKPADFTLLDNNAPQTIRTFREVDGQVFSADVHLVLVLDAINDGGSAIGHLKRDFGKWLAQSAADLPFPLSLVFVADSGVEQTQPSTDRAVIASQLAQLARRPRASDCEQKDSPFEGGGLRQPAIAAGSRLEDRANCRIAHFTQSIAALRRLLGEQRNVNGRAIVIWPGPGWPLVADYGREPGPEQPRGNYRDVLTQLTTNLRESQVTLDAISWGEFEHPKDTYKPIASATPVVPSTADQVAEEAMAQGSRQSQELRRCVLSMRGRC